MSFIDMSGDGDMLNIVMYRELLARYGNCSTEKSSRACVCVLVCLCACVRADLFYYKINE